MKITEYIEYSAEVRQAMGDGRPVVAIETAGTFEAFAYPENKAFANLVMERIRKEGAVPAYIAVINGRIRVGLEPAEVEYLAAKNEPLVKALRRDIPILLTKQMDALTAVAATMMVADMTGIKLETLLTVNFSVGVRLTNSGADRANCKENNGKTALSMI